MSRSGNSCFYGYLKYSGNLDNQKYGRVYTVVVDLDSVVFLLVAKVVVVLRVVLNVVVVLNTVVVLVL